MPIKSKDTVKSDVALAAQALRQATHSVTTSHDIISRAVMPALILNDQGESLFSLSEQQKMQLQEYLRYTRCAQGIRDYLAQDKAIQAESSKVFLSCLLTTLLGVGECHETANTVVLELIRRGFSKLYLISFIASIELNFGWNPAFKIFSEEILYDLGSLVFM